MDRRRWIASATMSLISSHFILRGESRDPITISAGEVRLNTPGGWTITAKDIAINGLTIPMFEASWVAVNLAAGVLSAVWRLSVQHVDVCHRTRESVP